ncbi:hypothetical protein H1C71_029424, partial [Ictidomys tridecemlineatus]
RGSFYCGSASVPRARQGPRALLLRAPHSGTPLPAKWSSGNSQVEATSSRRRPSELVPRYGCPGAEGLEGGARPQVLPSGLYSLPRCGTGVWLRAQVVVN